MTEKDFRGIITKLELTKIQKEEYDTKINNLIDIVKQNLQLTKIENIMRSGSLAIGFSFPNEIDIEYSLLLTTNIKVLTKNTKTLALNDLENSLLINDISYQRNDSASEIVIKIGDIIYHLLICFENNDKYNLQHKKDEINFFVNANNEFSLFINTVKLIKSFVKEQSVTIMNDEVISLLLYYGLRNYYIGNRYSEYINSFIKSLDDFLNYKPINVQKNYVSNTFKKIYIVSDLYDEEINLTNHINEINVAEYRKIRKALSRIIDLGSEKIYNSNDPINLIIDPVLDKESMTYMWCFKIDELRVNTSGGTYSNTIDEQISASLKALSKGLKYIVDNNLNKKVNVKCNFDYVLSENLSLSTENISRRKNILSYIQNNNLKITMVKK